MLVSPCSFLHAMLQPAPGRESHAAIFSCSHISTRTTCSAGSQPVPSYTSALGRPKAQ